MSYVRSLSNTNTWAAHTFQETLGRVNAFFFACQYNFCTSRQFKARWPSSFDFRLCWWDSVRVSEDEITKIISRCIEFGHHFYQNCPRLPGCFSSRSCKHLQQESSFSHCPRASQTAVIKPQLKKNGLGPNISKNYRPVSNLPYVSKLSERVVAEQLVSHLNQHDLLNKF